LLGALFGVNIISFIFGNFGTLSDSTFTDTGVTVLNETGAYLNITGYTLAGASVSGATGYVITAVWNVTVPASPVLLLVGNYTLSSLGVLTNATVTEYPDTNVSYTYTRTSDLELVSDDVTNQSLQAGLTYAQNASNQMNIVNVTIILSLLIFLFFLFWKVIQTTQKTEGSGKRKASGNPSKSSYA